MSFVTDPLMTLRLGQWRQQLTKERYLHRDMKMTAKLNDTAFKEHFRLSRTQFEHFLQEVGYHIKVGSQVYSISVETKMLVFLRFLAQGSYQLAVANDLTVSVSRPSVSIIIKEILQVFDNVVCPRYIKFPTEQEMRRTALMFLEKYGMPNSMGCIDGTHVRLAQVTTNDVERPEHLYVNRKNFYSLNVLIICDAEYRILAVNAKYPGSASDAFVYKYSVIRELVQGHCTQPQLWLLGDSAYGLEPTLLTPVREPADYKSNLYNQYHKSARSTVERAIGVLKARWRCLRQERGLHYSPSTAGKMVNAAVALHNFCLDHGENYRRVRYERDELIPQPPPPILDQFLAGQAIRNEVIKFIFEKRVGQSRLAQFLHQF